MLNSKLYKKEIRENMIKFLLGILLLGAVALIIALPSFPSPPLNSLTEQGLNGDGDNTFLQVWKQWNLMGLTLSGALVAIILGAGTFAQEKAKGTLFFLSSLPLSREEIYNTKVAAGLTLLGICLLGTNLLFVVFSSPAKIHIPLSPILTGAFLAFCALAVLYQATVIFSLLTGDMVKAGTVSALLCLLLSLPAWTAGGESYTFLLQYRGFLPGEPFPWPVFLLLVIIFFLLRHLGYWLWSREDI